MLGFSLGEFALGELDDEYVPPPPVPPPSPVPRSLDYSLDDFVHALQNLLPRGRVWPRDPDATQSALLKGFAASFVKSALRASYLLTDGFPASTLELIGEWEETLGLPDPCAGDNPTISQRRAQIVARLANQGGQSVAFFKEYAAALGYLTIVITEFSPTHTAGYLSSETPPVGNDWAYTWQVRAPDITIHYFRAGFDVCGTKLVSADGGDVLKCEFDRLKPAHTRLVFAPL